MNDHCLQRTAAQKTATGISVYLLEELGDARLRCAQLKKYIDEAVQMIDKSEHRDHFFEVAAHLLHGIPDTLMRLDKALSAAALGAAKMDYEEIKDDLQPEKVDELERALEEVRVRRIQRRSKEARSTDAVMAMHAMTAFRDVVLPALQHHAKDALEESVANMMVEFARVRAGQKSGFSAKLRKFAPPEDGESSEWIDHIEEVMEKWFVETKRAIGVKSASLSVTQTSAQLEHLAAEIEATGRVPLDALRHIIARLEAGHKRASVPSTVEGLRSLAASLLDNIAAEDRPSRVQLASTLRKILADNLDMTAVYSTASSREDVIKGFREANPSMSDDDLEKAADEWEKNKDVVKDKQAADAAVADQAQRARFEEGKPADPTENMDPEDASKWKAQTEEHKNEFKAASSDPWKVVMAAGFRKTPARWTERNGRWLSSVSYANDDTWNWEIREGTAGFEVRVTPPRLKEFQWKQTADTLEKAKRFAERYIEDPQGGERLNGGDLSKLFSHAKQAKVASDSWKVEG